MTVTAYKRPTRAEAGQNLKSGRKSNTIILLKMHINKAVLSNLYTYYQHIRVKKQASNVKMCNWNTCIIYAEHSHVSPVFSVITVRILPDRPCGRWEGKAIRILCSVTFRKECVQKCAGSMVIFCLSCFS